MTAVKRAGKGLGINRKGRSKRERYVRLDYPLLNSAAWNALPHPGRSLFIELSKRFNGSNNGEISFSWREVQTTLNVGQNTPGKLFQQLQDKGFIRINQRGAFTTKNRMATTWILTTQPYGTHPPTRDFMHWKPDEEKTTATLRVAVDHPESGRGLKLVHSQPP